MPDPAINTSYCDSVLQQGIRSPPLRREIIDNSLPLTKSPQNSILVVYSVMMICVLSIAYGITALLSYVIRLYTHNRQKDAQHLSSSLVDKHFPPTCHVANHIPRSAATGLQRSVQHVTKRHVYGGVTTEDCEHQYYINAQHILAHEMRTRTQAWKDEEVQPSQSEATPEFRDLDMDDLDEESSVSTMWLPTAATLEELVPSEAESTLEPPQAEPESRTEWEAGIYPCRGCGEVLEEGKAFMLQNYKWHLDCFKCDTCKDSLGADDNLLLLGDGSLVCQNCTYDCSGCGNKIEDLAILTGDKAFCSDCFKCRNCKVKIENLKYARTSQGIFCMRCHDVLMERRRKKTSERIESQRKALPPLPSSERLAIRPPLIQRSATDSHQAQGSSHTETNDQLFVIPPTDDVEQPQSWI